MHSNKSVTTYNHAYHSQFSRPKSTADISILEGFLQTTKQIVEREELIELLVLLDHYSTSGVVMNKMLGML